MNPYHQSEAVTIYHGDCIEVMAGMDENSIDAVVCDPPYGLEFMGKEWDKLTNYQEFSQQWATQALRVLKPGGYLLAFGGTRTYHRLVCGLEDAGFEIRDTIAWIYGSGFPKSLDISKQIDKLKAEVKVVNPEFEEVRAWLRKKIIDKGLKHKEIDSALGNPNSHQTSHYIGISQPQLPTPEDWLILKKLLQIEDELEPIQKSFTYKLFEREIIGKGQSGKTAIWKKDGNMGNFSLTAPSTPEAQEWQGWGTALKPAHEPICVARKPLSEKNVALNVLKWGTGGIDIDGSRIPTDRNQEREYDKENASGITGSNKGIFPMGEQQPRSDNWLDKGRFPANLILDEEAGAMLDEQSGELGNNLRKDKTSTKGKSIFGVGQPINKTGFSDSGGASRFFYCPKASTKDRGNGNTHPTCKPVKLMEYLIRLVSREGAVVLDPFLGSGTTIMAGQGRYIIGIEQSEEYCEIAAKRRMSRMVLPGPASVEKPYQKPREFMVAFTPIKPISELESVA